MYYLHTHNKNPQVHTLKTLSLDNKRKNIPLAKLKLINFPLWGTVNIWSVLHFQLCLVLGLSPYKKEKLLYNFCYQQTISSWMYVSTTVFLKYSITHFSRVILMLLGPDSWLFSQGPSLFLSLVFALFTDSFSEKFTDMLFAFCYRLFQKLLHKSGRHTSLWRTPLIPYSMLLLTVILCLCP